MSTGGLPSFEEAAKEAYRKAKEAGAGTYEPGSVKDSQRHIDAATGTGQLAAPGDQQAVSIPPVIRSSLTFSGQCSMITSRSLGRAIPGAMGGLLYQGRAFSYAAGFRDGTRGFDNEDKGNHLKLRDPVGLHKLTVPVTGILAWKLHKEGVFDLFKPITEYLPELPRGFDAINGRDVLAFRVDVRDEYVFRTLGASVPSLLDPKRYHKYHEQVWKPVGKALSGASASESRQALLTHLAKEAGKLPRPRRLAPMRGKMSHCAIAMLALAMERAGSRPFEQLMEENVFHAVEAPSAGFGVPKVINRSHIFYQPGGLPAGHWTSTKGIPPEQDENAAPPVFNSSLNMFANPEEYAKLATTSFEAAVNAVKEFPQPQSIEPFYELGIWYEPGHKTYWIKQDYTGREVPTPWSGSANYNLDKDVGAYIIANCGSRRARFTTNLAALATTKLFIKQVLDAGLAVWEGDEAPPDVTHVASKHGTHEQKVGQEDQDRLNRMFDKQSYSKWVGGMDNHTRL